jgi:hypothetical protein
VTLSPLRLAALKIGVGTPSAPFAGIVHSVFANAAILAIADRLATLAPASAGGLPGAITIAVGSFRFCDHLVVGAPAVARGGVLRLGDGAMTIDLRDAVPWRAALREHAVDLANARAENAWRSVAAALRIDGRSAAIARIGGAPMLMLCEAARRFDARSAAEAMAPLVGLGAGGTPAGDDVLVGFLAGLWSTAWKERSRRDFAGALGNSLGGLLGRTNDVSRLYLEAARDAEVSERLSALIAGIGAGEPATILASTATAAISVGHTSGADGVLGLLLGLAAWAPAPVFEASRGLVAADPRSPVGSDPPATAPMDGRRGGFRVDGDPLA